ncbi:hypothetical protein [Sphingomonas jatrophae]|uniref:Transposase n=1 Tax=Sphingomonas jatrophae TaxID=1166337 RepID=A0A1I6K696_9SPHN|nr:hypothetical protein [Sphingomonas jatrophae]SFR86664.1 hypothetical protein SAMN05192580_1365 [Sphingomonas jatrophae]
MSNPWDRNEGKLQPTSLRLQPPARGQIAKLEAAKRAVAKRQAADDYDMVAERLRYRGIEPVGA